MIDARFRLGRPSRIAIAAALCGAVLGCAPVAAQADPSEGLPPTATHVIGFRGQLACGTGGYFAELSDDRGATWRQGSTCLPWDAAMPRVVDPSTGGVLYVNGDDIEGPGKPAPATAPELIFVDPNTGGRSWDSPVLLDPSRAVDSYAADNGVAYVVTNDWPDGTNPAYTLQRYTGPEPQPCDVSLPGPATWSVLSLAGAILVENRQGPVG